MQIAIPVWRGRVSPLFDSAGCVLVIRLQAGRELERWRLRLRGYPPAQRLHLMLMARIDVLICGALSSAMRRMMESAGVTVIAWRTGQVEDVIHAYLNDILDDARFLLPGRCHVPGRGHGRGLGRGKKYGTNPHKKRKGR